MPSTFFGLEIGTRALQSNQTALNVVSNNTANIDTPGYSRQVVNLDETNPYTLPDSSPSKPGQLGTGVTVASVTRVRDQFVDQRVWGANSQQGAVSTLKDTLATVEGAYNEPSDSSIGQGLTDLFNSFSDLSANPQSGPVRTTVLNRAESLVTAFHTVSASLTQITPQLTSKIGITIDSVNQIAGQIAALNKEIGQSVAVGDTPNDLQDKRGQLIDQLSQYVDVQVLAQKNGDTNQPNGQLNINVGGFSLVQGDSANTLPKTVATDSSTPGLLTSDGTTLPLRGGQVYGLIQAGILVKGYQSDLDTLAYNVVNATNQRHLYGYGLDGSTNNAFFGALTASDGAASSISVDTGIQADPDKIAAATAPTPPATYAPGNGDNARSLASLASTQVIGSLSLDSYYNAKVSGIGADAKTFQQQSSNQDAIVSQLKNQQSSVSGVNLDEELTKMLQYQRAYQAAARVINMADSFLDKIINGLGASATG